MDQNSSCSFISTYPTWLILALFTSPLKLCCMDDQRLTWCLDSRWPLQREGESEYGISLAVFDSLSQKATIFIHHTVSNSTVDSKPGSNQIVWWAQKQHQENSAALAVNGLKMEEAGGHCSQSVFFPFTTRAQGHTNKSKMSVNTKYKLLARLLTAWVEPL